MASLSETASKKALVPAQKELMMRLIEYSVLLKGYTEERTT